MRKSGILMHITSLPGPYGIGCMGKSAFDFVDFLASAGQSYWQILPLSPTGYGDSPYQAFSAFAGNHYLIDLEELIAEGLLNREEVSSICWEKDPSRVDFGTLYTHRTEILRLAFNRFQPKDDYRRFVDENKDWLEDYALFMALKEAFPQKTWQDWSLSLMMRLPAIVEAYRQEYRQAIAFQYFLQYQFYRQWTALRSYANSKGIRIIGDVPIYVPLDSADVWANAKLFQLDKNYRPVRVAGCPPDSFSADGQLWGNPLYDWEKMKADGYRWWICRLKAAQRMYDVVRLDHFRGFESYWSIPATDDTAKNGTWEKGPGLDFIHAIQQAIPGLELIAEDLGFVTDAVRELQEASGAPGMKVLQFAFDSREAGDYLPHRYPVNSVCYCGTHDNPTLGQWLEDAAPADVAYAKSYLGLTEEEGYIKGMIRSCMNSVSKLCIIPIQDYLEFGPEARMNHPGTLSCRNWTWRAKPGFATTALAGRILDLTCRHGRK